MEKTTPSISTSAYLCRVVMEYSLDAYPRETAECKLPDTIPYVSMFSGNPCSLQNAPYYHQVLLELPTVNQNYPKFLPKFQNQNWVWPTLLLSYIGQITGGNFENEEIGRS